MRFKLLCCDVLTREVCYCIARSPHTISPVFTAKGEHNAPDQLRALIQNHIDQATEGEFDAILLAYGLCGNATLGLTARTCPLIIPRAHDCTTLFLGSKAAFKEHFGDNPSQTWTAVGYAERGTEDFSGGDTRLWLGEGHSYEALVAQYGEENAKYLHEALGSAHQSKDLFLLDLPETRIQEIVDRIHAAATEKDLTVKILPARITLIQQLLSGDWDPQEFLTVPPGHKVAGVYDWDTVLEAQPE